MLFSHPEIAARLNEGFECAWQSVRAVPKIEIDFGDGRRLERTLNGNVATLFCTPQGELYDLVPGIVSPEEYLARLGEASRLFAALSSSPDPRRLVGRYHQESARLARLAPALARAEIELELHQADMAKMWVEHSLKKALGNLHLARTSETGRQGARQDAHGDPPAAENELAADTEHNRIHRYPLAHALLAEQPLAPWDSLTSRVYREILGVDLDDPWLGLAPYVLGGELGRREPEPERASR